MVRKSGRGMCSRTRVESSMFWEEGGMPGIEDEGSCVVEGGARKGSAWMSRRDTFPPGSASRCCSSKGDSLDCAMDSMPALKSTPVISTGWVEGQG